MNTNTYIVMFCRPGTDETLLQTVDKMTFAEAASWAFMRRHDLGHEWKIDCIKTCRDKDV